MREGFSEIGYDYTEKVKIDTDALSKLPYFCSREDAAEMLKRIKKAPKDRRPFLMRDLQKLCETGGWDIDALLKDPDYLKEIPSREDVLNQLMEDLYSLYRKVPAPADYMERLVRRLAPEYKDDTVRVAILKKFLAGAGFKWKSLKTEAIHQWALRSLSEEEQSRLAELEEDARLERILEGINEEIFGENRLNAELDEREILALMVNRIRSFHKEYAPIDKEGKTLKTDDFVLSRETKELLAGLCEKHGIAYDPDRDKAVDALQEVWMSCTGEELAEQGFFACLREDFNRQMRNTYYLNKKNKIDRMAALFKNDRHDADRAKNENWKLLEICDDFAKGKFRTNGGKTRVYLYYFALMFHMTFSLDGSNLRDDRTDIAKNLFEDYYCDNLLRFLEADYADPEQASFYEKEPAGDGINFKNFMEVIYLYYLQRTDLALTPGERIDRAEKMIRKCVRDAKKANLLQEETQDATRIYRDRYRNEMLQLTEKELPGYILENYQVDYPGEESGVSRILLASDEITAYDMMSEFLEDLDDMYSVSAEYSSELASDYGDDDAAFEEEAEYLENDAFLSALGQLLREKYGDDADFMKILNVLEKRFAAESGWIGRKKKRVMVYLLYLLYYNSTPEKSVRLSKLKTRLADENIYVSGAEITEAAVILAELGFDVHRELKGSESCFYLGSRMSEQEDQQEMLDILKSSRKIKEEKLLFLLEDLVNERIPDSKRITRSAMIAVCTKRYIAMLDVEDTIDDFKTLCEDFKEKLDVDLENARFQKFSQKNIYDMYVLASLYTYVMKNMNYMI